MRRRAAARGEFLPRLRASCERAQDGEEARERSRDGHTDEKREIPRPCHAGLLHGRKRKEAPADALKDL